MENIVICHIRDLTLMYLKNKHFFIGITITLLLIGRSIRVCLSEKIFDFVVFRGFLSMSYKNKVIYIAETPLCDVPT